MDIRKAYLVGIGGIGMSALAQYLARQGISVSGSDRSSSPTTDLLEEKGIRTFIGHDAGHVPEDASIVIYSDAVMPDNAERARAGALGIPQISYFGMLGRVSRGKRTLAISGTHGKTTTTGMTAKILRDAGLAPTAVIGSLVRDFGSNYLHGEGEWFVIEACEYKNHLLELTPEILVVNNLEWDHTDFFSSLDALQETFGKAIERVPETGCVITDPNNPNIAPLLPRAKAKIIDYTKEPEYELQLPGDFNKMNARAAAAAARAVLPAISDATIAQALASFQGTWRRFEFKGRTERGAKVYDDYAHHPTAIKVTLKALREKTNGKIFAVFHPHLYSRTKDLFEEFADSFKDADEVLIAPIYAAREKDDGSVSSEKLAERATKNGTRARAVDFDEIEKILVSEPGPGDVIMTIGAGDIYKIADRLVRIDAERSKVTSWEHFQ